MSDGIHRAFCQHSMRRKLLNAVQIACARAERLGIETPPALQQILENAGAPGPEVVSVVRTRHVTPSRDFH